jgi:hypothetical protein
MSLGVCIGDQLAPSASVPVAILAANPRKNRECAYLRMCEAQKPTAAGQVPPRPPD